MTQTGIPAIKNITKSYLHKLPQPLINLFYQCYSYVKYPDSREKKMSYGDRNPDVTFYVIRPRTDGVEGLMALMTSVLQHLHYADVNGYIPVVDFENYKTQYKDIHCAEANAWKYYFQQVSTYPLAEVYQSKNVILAGLGVNATAPKYLRRDFTPEGLSQAKRIWERYIHYSKAVLELVSSEKEAIKPSDCIGLYLRGTDYIKLRPAGEDVQPTAEQAFVVVDEMCKKYNKKYVFLVTEDETLYKTTLNCYGDKVKIVSYDSFIKGYTGSDFLSKDQTINQLSDSPYLRGLRYLAKLILLSECKAIVGGNTCGSWASCIMAPVETEKYIFQLGKY